MDNSYEDYYSGEQVDQFGRSFGSLERAMNDIAVRDGEDEDAYCTRMELAREAWECRITG